MAILTGIFFPLMALASGPEEPLASRNGAVGARRYVEIILPDHRDVYRLNRFTVVGAGPNYARALVSDAEIRELVDLGFRVNVLIDDYQTYKDSLFYRGYYRTYQQVYLALDSLARAYPGICLLDTIGFSVQGRPIWAMRLTDNPDREEHEPEIRLAGNIHGDEHIGTEITLYFLRYLCVNYGSNSQVQEIVNNRELWIMPVLNPDGKVNNTRENANYVDLNRDGGYMWAGWGGGSGPCSQPENRALQRHLIENDIGLEFSYHSQAFYVNYPWDYHPADPPDSQHIIDLSRIYADSAGLNAINGFDWYQVCGSLQDYTTGVAGGLAWTIETDEPAGSAAIDQICYENRNALLDLCARAGWGIAGSASDSVAGSPLGARIEFPVPERIDVYADPVAGDFHKMIQPGTYTVRISANGYRPKTLGGIAVPASGAIDIGDVPLVRDTTYRHAFRVVTTIYAEHAEQSNRTAPRYALGPVDNRFYSLGEDGEIILDMGSATPIQDIAGDDFMVYEGSDGVSEGYAVFAAGDWIGPWGGCGSGTGSMSFDLNDAGMSQARYLKIVDDGSVSSGPYAGFDLDAVRFFGAGQESEEGYRRDVSAIRAFRVSSPGRGRVRIEYEISNPKSVMSLSICDAAGRTAARIRVDGRRSSAIWDGTDRQARAMPSGVYFFRLRAEDEIRTEKAVLLR